MTKIEAHPLGRGALVLAAALIVFAAALLTRDAPEAPPAEADPTVFVPSATATPEATPTPAGNSTATAEPTATPRPGPEPTFGELPPALEAAEAGTWVREVLAAGTEPTPNHGVLVRDLGSGGGEHWSLAGGSPRVEFVAYGVAGDGRFATFGTPFTPETLADRQTGVSFNWDTEVLQFVGASARGQLLFATTRSEDDDCLFWAVDIASGSPEALLRFGLEGDRTCSGASAVFDPLDADQLLIGANDTDGGSATIYAVDLGAGTVTTAGDKGAHHPLVGDGDGAHWIEPFGNPIRDETLGLVYGHYDWESRVSTSTRFEATATGGWITSGLPSPDGTLIAWQESLRLGQAAGLGGDVEWPVVVIADRASAEPLLRVVRAAVANELQSGDWLADSSALLLTTEAGIVLLELGGDRTTLDQATLNPLGFGTALAGFPQPAPGDPALFALGTQFVDRDRTELLPPLASDWARQGPLRGDWTSGGTEYYLATWDRGATDAHAAPVASFGLEARIDTLPFSNDVRLVTTGPIDLRTAASHGSEASWPLEAGTIAVVQNDESLECLFDFGCATRTDPPGTDPREAWLFVRTEDGRAGWAESSSFAWSD